MINIQDDVIRLHALGVLEHLLADKTTGHNILWAADAYAERGSRCEPSAEITSDLITGPENAGIIQTRARKAFEQQSERTRKWAEVYTPLWIVKKMCDFLDEQWFKRKDGFNKVQPDTGHVVFTAAKTWKQYVQSRRLEITCGEAPFLVSRYDAVTGNMIPIEERTGLLDRKLRVIGENTETEADWLQWSETAFQNIYGYELQGDSLLVARVNLLMTFAEYLNQRWNRSPTLDEYRRFSHIICWNIWQMDGLKGTVPAAVEEMAQISFFESSSEPPPDCKIYNWRQQRSTEYRDINRGNSKMKFDFIIGNPPYQEETESNSTRMPPIYNLFMDQAYLVSEKTELITPARFLYNAGYTPKQWNEKMLHDKHFKVIYYEPESSKIFANTDIKGGIAISFRDETKDFGEIDTFTKYRELNTILAKVKAVDFQSLENIISSPLSFQLSDIMKSENPNLLDRLRSSAFSTLSGIFFDECPQDGSDYIKMIGLQSGKRTIKYVRRDYIKDSSGTLDNYTLLVAKANGAGYFGEVLSEPVVAEPGTAYTQTFIAIGKYDNEQEARNTRSYIRTKFCRAMLGVLKITQDCPGPKWKYVPLQDFTSSSDIDWSVSIPEIDRQLYAKYGLDQEEIDFIESHVKEMT